MKIKSKINVVVIALLVLALSPNLYAADPAKPSASSAVHQGRGVVEAVDPAKGLVTVEHESITSLRWPKMVMNFKTQNPDLLKGLKEGDQIEFDLVQSGKEYYITRIQPLR